MESNGLVSLGRQFSLFAFVGAVGTGAQLYRHYTFRSGKRHQEAMPMFLTVVTVGFLLNAAIMWLAVGVVQLHYLLAQIFASSIVLVWNYLGNRTWTFAKERICSRS
jgi:putative flippase GtrA